MLPQIAQSLDLPGQQLPFKKPTNAVQPIYFREAQTLNTALQRVAASFYLLPLAVVLTAPLGCGTAGTGSPGGAKTVAQNFAGLKLGMAKADVERLLGPPHEYAVVMIANDMESNPTAWHSYRPTEMPLDPTKATDEADKWLHFVVGVTFEDRVDQKIRYQGVEYPGCGVDVDLYAVPPQWKSGVRLYAFSTFASLDADIMHFQKPEPQRSGERLGDYQRRVEKFKKRVIPSGAEKSRNGGEGGLSYMGYYIQLNYDENDKLSDATAWAPQFELPPDGQAPPGWDENSMGRWDNNRVGHVLLEQAGLKAAPRPK